MASIARIAKEAGVSTGTVSNVLHDRPVRPATRAAVEAAMKTLKHAPVKRARRGRPEGEPLDAVLLRIHHASIRSVARHPVYCTLLHGVERACREAGLSFELSSEGSDASVDAGDPRRGVLVFDAERAAGGVDGAAVVRVLGRVGVAQDEVTYDDAEVGRLAAGLLLDAGVQNAGLVCDRGWARGEAFVAAVEAAGGRVRRVGVPVLEAPGLQPGLDRALDASVDAAALRSAVAGAFLGANPGERLVEGVFCFSDEAAAHTHAILASEAGGRHAAIPLVGCNHDAPYRTGLSPQPHTIDLHLDAVGHQAVRLLLHRAARPADPPVRLLVRPTAVRSDGG